MRPNIASAPRSSPQTLHITPPGTPAPTITAVLGPTNTGKTHHAIQRLLRHRSGVIGVPLRLLAREVYERVVASAGPAAVALITGEEKEVPSTARYFICTVESMPMGRPFEFLAVDEVQLARHPERGHHFTDRLLHARGTRETLFLGAETIAPLLRELVPEARQRRQSRLSELCHSGTSKLARLPHRSAVVAFSAHDVYELAEQFRSRHGGAALVLGALSPRARNAQVAMYQAGEVQHLVATDAIGLGLNLELEHVAFSSLRKFDGRTHRDLALDELAQIAGRAGRHRTDGTFGTLAGLGPLPDRVAHAIERHHFPAIQRIYYRNPTLDYQSIRALRRSLVLAPPHPLLAPVEDAGDLQVLDLLTLDPEITARAATPERVELFWEVCRIPDFRRTLAGTHPRLLGQIFTLLCDGPLPDDWVEPRVAALERSEGDIEVLMGRIADIRTWTYISHREHWLEQPRTWQVRTREIEDKLSDVLHERLTARFVDQRRRAFMAENLAGTGAKPAEVDALGRVRIAGSCVGRVRGLEFEIDPSLEAPMRRTIRPSISTMLQARVTDFDQAPSSDIELDAEAAVRWKRGTVARLVQGTALNQPRVRIAPLPALEGSLRNRVHGRLSRWQEAWSEELLGPLTATEGQALEAAARGILYRLREELGSLPRRSLEELLKALSDPDRKSLAARGIRMGRHHVYVRPLLRPWAIQRRALHWAVHHGRPPIALPTEPSFARTEAHPVALLRAAGFAPLGPRAVRHDILERVDALLRRQFRSRGTGDFPLEPASWMGCSLAEAEAVAGALGWRRDPRGRWRR